MLEIFEKITRKKYLFKLKIIANLANIYNNQ